MSYFKFSFFFLLKFPGCMAERLKDKLLQKGKVVDIVAGPDSYRSLPYLLSQASSHQVNKSITINKGFALTVFFFRLLLM